MADEQRVLMETRQQWRDWLANNHDTASGIWLVTWRKQTGKSSLPYEAAVEEALCFGWIDSVMRRIDDEQSMLRFSPRRPGGVWARSNKERIERLEASGAMTESGRAVIEAAKTDGSWTILDDAENLIVPEDFASALARLPPARTHFDAFSPSAQRAMLGWIAQAKRPDTRARRIAACAEKAAKDERLT